MSNLVAAPGQSPDFDPRKIQTVNVREIGVEEMSGANEEIDLRELWRAVLRRKKLIAVTATGVVILATLLTIHQRLFQPVYQGSFAL